MADDPGRAMASAAMKVSEALQAELVGLHPSVQGAVLADLVSIFFAGHRPDVRPDAIRRWDKVMRDLIPASEQQIMKQYGHHPWGGIPNG